MHWTLKPSLKAKHGIFRFLIFAQFLIDMFKTSFCELNRVSAHEFRSGRGCCDVDAQRCALQGRAVWRHAGAGVGLYGNDPSALHKVISSSFLRPAILELDQAEHLCVVMLYRLPHVKVYAGLCHESASGRAVRLHAGRGAEGVAHRDQPVAAHPCAACGRHGVARGAGG